MNLISSDFRAGNRSGFGTGLNAAEVVRIFGQWQERARQRRQLARLDDAQLADIGLSRDAAMAEASKSFWQR